ncbi:LysR family transcriptional regulator [Paenochrobactrum glaciei]|uniref:LysR family transcriptional regulator n=1 Tax=Paenochrobactrum glaciei TaxID=486407 RepID=A0ABN1G6P1_9HYPH
MSDKRLSQIDMNLLITLDALLSEGSVAGAAQRMNLSAPAMSRQLTRIRELFDDPILVRAGRGLVPTPRAEELREPLRQFVLAAETLVRGEGEIDPRQLERTFTVRSNDGFVGAYGAAIAQAVFQEAAKVRLYFAPQGNEDVEALREGKVDLDIGVIGAMGPEVRLQALFHDRFIGVVRRDHPIATQGASLKNFILYPHVSVSRRGRFDGPIDKALAAQGKDRTVSLAVASFSESLEIVRRSDYIAAMPDRLTHAARRDLFTFPLPVQADALAISQAWHPRFDADPAHRWLRALVRRICSNPV